MAGHKTSWWEGVSMMGEICGCVRGGGGGVRGKRANKREEGEEDVLTGD